MTEVWRITYRRPDLPLMARTLTVVGPERLRRKVMLLEDQGYVIISTALMEN